MKTRLHSRCLFVHGWQEERGRGALVSGSSRNKLPRTGRLVTTAVYSLAVPEVRIQKRGVSQAKLPAKALAKDPPRLFPLPPAGSLPVAAWLRCPPPPPRGLPPPGVLVCASDLPLSSLRGHQLWDSGSALNLGCCSLKILNFLRKGLSSKQGHVHRLRG